MEIDRNRPPCCSILSLAVSRHDKHHTIWIDVVRCRFVILTVPLDMLSRNRATCVVPNERYKLVEFFTLSPCRSFSISGKSVRLGNGHFLVTESPIHLNRLARTGARPPTARMGVVGPDPNVQAARLPSSLAGTTHVGFLHYAVCRASSYCKWRLPTKDQCIGFSSILC
jgi:hypothetical protein